MQCRPKGYEIFKKSIDSVSGLAKRARFVMSHATGKIEYVGLDEKIYMKYHRAADPNATISLWLSTRNPDAYWLDDYVNPDSLV